MEHDSQSHISSFEPVSAGSPVWLQDDVLCQIRNESDLDDLVHARDAKGLKTLTTLGFTGVLLTPEIEGANATAVATLRDSGIKIFTSSSAQDSFNGGPDTSTGTYNQDKWISGRMPSVEFWQMLETDFGGRGLLYASMGVGAQNDHFHRNVVSQMLQMAVPLVPVVPLADWMIPSRAVYGHAASRDMRELLRSLIFWRVRFRIAGSMPNLVHAGEDGLLIFTVDSWLVALNQNPDESSIDLGRRGSMWLMLGTERDVQLHGNLLVLPPFTGAILANELAR